MEYGNDNQEYVNGSQQVTTIARKRPKTGTVSYGLLMAIYHNP